MSKAKELARVVEDLYSRSKIWDMNIDSEISDIVYLSVDLCRAVLSEPEPLKGWIEIGEAPYRQLLHLYSGKIFEEYAERVRVQGYGGYIDQNISFDDFKAKIARAV